MDTRAAIRRRRSIRAFTPEMPGRDLINECLQAAAWAPNPTGQQPWKFIVLSGESLQRICRTISDSFAAAQSRRAGPPPAVSPEIAAMLDARKQDSIAAMMEFLQTHDIDTDKLGQGNFTFHRAPLAILFCTYPCRDQNFLKAAIAAMENFMLAAVSQGLGTCWCNAVSICAQEIKEALDLHPDIILVDGIAVGFPDGDAPLNRLPRERLPLAEISVWRD